MKNLFLLVVLFVSFQTFSQNQKGQAKGQGKTPEQKAEAAVKRWTNSLNLTAEQQPKVKAVILDRIQKVDAIKAKYKNSQDKKAMHQEMKAVKESTEKSLQEILTPEQVGKMQQIKEEKRKKAQEKKGKGISPEEADDIVDE